MKSIFFSILVFASFQLSAKKIMFAVNMEAWVVDSAGVHVTGDFQDEAGFAADWDPGTTDMVQDVNDTNIWWIVLDIPAFSHYEFKYVNGDQGYQQEFVPVESRVNYNFIDNRWIYVDSLSNDTLHLPAVRFSGNAPAGKNLIRLYVDMSNEGSVSSNGVHVATDMNAFSTTDGYMYSFDGFTYEYLSYVDSGLTSIHEYKFFNGNAAGDVEVLAGWCANGNGYRTVSAPRDTMLPVVCYTFCAACNTVGIAEIQSAQFTMMPNPSTDIVNLGFSDNAGRTISVVDQRGREVEHVVTDGESSLALIVSSYSAGLYYVRVMDTNGHTQVQKLIIQ
jgi:hypothetical protein